MVLLPILIAAALAAGSPAVISRVAPGVPQRVRLWAIPVAVASALVLAWSAAAMDSLSLLFAIGLGCAAAVLGVQFIIDIAVQRLPRILSYVGLVLYTVFVVGSDSGDAAGLRGLLVGLLLMTAITGLLVIASRGAFGIGDFHLSPLLGALVGWYSPAAVLILWIVAAALGSLFVVSALIVKRIRRDSTVPYGPFLILGSLVSTVWIACR